MIKRVVFDWSGTIISDTNASSSFGSPEENWFPWLSADGVLKQSFLYLLKGQVYR